MKRTGFLINVLIAAVLLSVGVAWTVSESGTNGNDKLLGTNDNDFLSGQKGNDQIFGLEGNDQIEGGSGNDQLYGGNKSQTVLAGNNLIEGGNGKDRIVGAPGIDELRGMAGADTIYDGPEEDAAEDLIFGGDGNDRLYTANVPASRDKIVCGEGRDFVRADPLDVVDKTTCEKVKTVKPVDLTLEKELPVDQALNVIDSINADPEQLIAVYSVGVDEYAAGYVIDEQKPLPSAEDVTQTITSSFKGDKQRLQKSAVAEANQSDAQAEQSTDPMPKVNSQTEVGELDTIIDTVQSNDARIDQIVVQTDKPVAELEQNPSVREAADVFTGARNKEVASIEPLNAGHPDSRWAPKRGYISTNCCYSTGHRYVYQSFEWNNWRMGNLKRINSYNVTYEPDATYNRAYGTYLGSVVSWSSNLPNRYLDTEFLDRFTSRGIRVLTVGTADAHKLRANKRYYTSIRATRGKQNGESAGATAQNGYRYPAGCFSRWCIEGRASDVLIFVNSGYNIPGARHWVSWTP